MFYGATARDNLPIRPVQRAGGGGYTPFATSETVCGAWAIKALQVKEAGEQERALTQYLMGVILFIQSHIKLQEVKQLKETAVCESMHGGVRGRGSNPPTYSIIRQPFILIPYQTLLNH
ncbi:MAG: hypothetical protein IPH58_09860 [Sphingobacteriales bacterium]|nr:hypothetical protein [Sphingobacteriales bacterium]